MSSNNQLVKQTFRSPLICRVCGDVARGLNFDVLTCVSCKAFFRRHALEEPLVSSYFSFMKLSK